MTQGHALDAGFTEEAHDQIMAMALGEPCPEPHDTQQTPECPGSNQVAGLMFADAFCESDHLSDLVYWGNQPNRAEYAYFYCLFYDILLIGPPQLFN